MSVPLGSLPEKYWDFEEEQGLCWERSESTTNMDLRIYLIGNRKTSSSLEFDQENEGLVDITPEQIENVIANFKQQYAKAIDYFESKHIDVQFGFGLFTRWS